MEGEQANQDDIADAMLAILKERYLILPGRIEFTTDGSRPSAMGGYGDVFCAVLHPCDDAPRTCAPCEPGADGHQQVAVKKLRGVQAVSGRKMKRRLVREMYIWSTSHHPNIIGFSGYHLDVDENDAWLICPWATHGNVTDYLKRETVPMLERLQLLRDTAEGLAWLHSHNPPICHGDIKGLNVLVGDHRQAMLCDFGLALLGEDNQLQNLNTTGSDEFRGSVPHCAPENFTTSKRTLRSDVWAWACLALEITVERTPYPGMPKIQLIAHIVKGNPPQVDDEPLLAPYPQLRRLMKNCWKMDPESRPLIRACLAAVHILISQEEDRIANPNRPKSSIRRTLKHFTGQVASKLTFPRKTRGTSPGTNMPVDIPMIPSPISSHHDATAGRPRTPPAGDSFPTDPLALESESPTVEDASPDLTTRVTKLKAKPTKAGGLSDVWEGELSPNGVKVAIKSLRGVDMGFVNPGSQEWESRLDKRLQREKRVWAVLRHRRIAPLLGYAMMDGQPCLITSWYANGNAAEYVAKHPDCNRRALIAQVAEGLVYLHTRNPSVVNYDCRPPNVLISDAGEAVLIGFGGARFLEDMGSGFTTSSAFPASTRFSAPEMFEGRDLTVKAATFSFGCFILVIMTGKAPFYDLRSTAAVIQAKFQGATPEPRNYPELPSSDPIWPLMRKCWHSNPERRPTMVEVQAELATLGYKP